MKKIFAAVLAAVTVIGTAGMVFAATPAGENGAASSVKEMGEAGADETDENLPIYAYQLTAENASTYYYTTNPDEASGITSWSKVKEAGIIGYSNSSDGEAVYRMRYKGSQDLPAIYAYVGAGETGNFETLGYINEGVAFYSHSGDAKIYRLHNPNNQAQYMFTPSSEERDFLVNAGWQDEGALNLSEMNYPKTPAYYQSPEQVDGTFVDEKMILANENCTLASVEVSNISSSDYEITDYAPTGQHGVKFRTAGAAEQAVVTARFTNAGTYMSEGQRIPIDYTLTFSHGIAYGAGEQDYYRPKRTFMEKGEYGIYFSDNPSEASILNLGLLSVDCEMKLYRSADGQPVTPSGAYLTFGSLNGYHDYDNDHFYDVEGVCALAPVSHAYVTEDTILRTGVYENYEKFMDPNNKGRLGYYGWQNSPSDFQDGESTKAVTYNRSCVTLVFDSSIKFAIQTYETRKGMIHWSLDAYPISNTRPDLPVKSVEDADGKPVSIVRKDQKITYRIAQKVNTWAKNAISKYTAFQILDTLPEGIGFESASFLYNGEPMAEKDYSVEADGQNVTCSLSDDYLLNMPMEGETYTLVLHCKITTNDGRTMKNHAVTRINHTDFRSNEVILTNQKIHTIVTHVENGTIDESITEIPEGESRTIHYAPAEGYVLKSVAVDGVSLAEEQKKQYESSYPFENITADHEIAVVYEKKKIPLTASKQVFFEDGKTSADGKIVPVGEPLIYRVTVSGGDETDGAVTVTDTIPENMKFQSADNGGTVSEGQIRWTIPSPGSGAAKVVSFVAIPQKAGALYENSALASAENQEPVKTNTVRSWTIEPKKTVWDESGKDLDGKAAAQGQTILYRISFKNPLPDKAFFTVRDEIPEGTEYVSMTGGGTFSDGAALWNTEVGAGETFSAELRVRLTRSGKFVNQASVTSGSVTGKTNPVTVHASTLQKMPNAGGAGMSPILAAAALAVSAGAVLDRKRRR